MVDFLGIIAILAFLVLGVTICCLLDRGYRQDHIRWKEADHVKWGQARCWRRWTAYICRVGRIYPLGVDRSYHRNSRFRFHWGHRHDHNRDHDGYLGWGTIELTGTFAESFAKRQKGGGCAAILGRVAKLLVDLRGDWNHAYFGAFLGISENRRKDESRSNIAVLSASQPRHVVEFTLGGSVFRCDYNDSIDGAIFYRFSSMTFPRPNGRSERSVLHPVCSILVSERLFHFYFASCFHISIYESSPKLNTHNTLTAAL